MKRTYALAVLTAAIVFAGLFSCELFNTVDPVTVKERIDLFETALNQENRDALFTHFHDDTADKQSVADAAVFDVGPLSFDYEPFTITVPETLPAEKEGMVTFNATFTNDNFLAADPGAMTFVMKELEKNVWYILKLTVAVDLNDDDDTEDENEEFEIRKLY